MGLEQVYPRVCGGTDCRKLNINTRSGLSPRVRGNLRPHAVGAELERSIPACAGEPAATAWTKSAPTVYPRVCGGTRGIAPVA